jgi:hypothetical protein
VLECEINDLIALTRPGREDAASDPSFLLVFATSFPGFPALGLNRIDNNRLAYHRAVLGGIGLCNRAPDGPRRGARSARRLLRSLDSHGNLAVGPSPTWPAPLRSHQFGRSKACRTPCSTFDRPKANAVLGSGGHAYPSKSSPRHAPALRPRIKTIACARGLSGMQSEARLTGAATGLSALAQAMLAP